MSTTLIEPDVIERVAARFKLLSEPVRLRLLNMLHVHGELSVSDMVERTALGQANVSKHLQLLAREGMVSRRQQGLRAYYDIADPMLAALCVIVCSQVETAVGKPAQTAGV